MCDVWKNHATGESHSKKMDQNNLNSTYLQNVCLTGFLALGKTISDKRQSHAVAEWDSAQNQGP